MELSEDYKDLFRILNEYKVKYLIIGAYAVIYYTEPRIDVWVKDTAEDADKIYNALKKFGAPLIDITPEDFREKGIVYQIGIAPVRIDVITGLKSVDFDKAWKNRKKIKYADIPVNMIDKNDLIKLKKATQRPCDIIDIEKLKLIK